MNRPFDNGNPFPNDGDLRRISLIDRKSKEQTAWTKQEDPISGFPGVIPNPTRKQIKPINKETSYSKILQRSMTMGTEFQNMNLDTEIENAVREALSWLSNHYTFQDSDKVSRFLNDNNTVREMLLTIYSNIRKIFPTERINLEVFSDSQNSDENDIVVSVVTSLPADEAIERLDRVEDVRWNKDSKDPYVNICVNLEYQ